MKTKQRGRNRGGWYLREVLARRGMRQRDLFRRLKVSSEQISRLCRREANPKWRTVQALARVLGVGVQEFASEKGDVA